MSNPTSHSGRVGRIRAVGEQPKTNLNAVRTHLRYRARDTLPYLPVGGGPRKRLRVADRALGPYPPYNYNYNSSWLCGLCDSVFTHSSPFK
ncbi:MAG: hypothetical protein ACKO81_06475 [Planctomycetota bacterium]